MDTNERTYTINISATFKSNLPLQRIQEELQLAIVNEFGNITITDNKNSPAFNVSEITNFELRDLGYEEGEKVFGS